MNRLPISVIILVYNEEENIKNCLESIYKWVAEIFIVDSGSTDRTLEIVRNYTDKIYQHSFVTQARQFNWALDNLPINTEWIMRLDADEMVTEELTRELSSIISHLPNEVTALYMKRKVFFMDHWIKHGAHYPLWLLRIWRRGKGHYENRWMDEHIIMSDGKKLFLKNDIIEKNNKGLHHWINKHNDYATRKMLDILKLKNDISNNEDEIKSALFNSQEERKRYLEERIYLKLPLFIRPFLYFIYRYFFKMGFLDGKEGLIWHFLQGLWYRFLIDAKIYEVRKAIKYESKKIIDILAKLYNIKMIDR